MTGDTDDPGAMSPQQVLDALDRQPRCVLGSYPTALVPLERFGRKVGREIYLKRDDTLGPAGGGNKTRKLEYLLADALELPVDRRVPLVSYLAINASCSPAFGPPKSHSVDPET